MVSHIIELLHPLKKCLKEWYFFHINNILNVFEQLNEIWSNVYVVALNYSKFVLCCIEFVLIVVCKTYVTLFWMCTHRFSNPRHESVCLELCANGFVDASHIAKLFKISFATNMCRVYLCPRIMFFCKSKKDFFTLQHRLRWKEPKIQ